MSLAFVVVEKTQENDAVCSPGKTTLFEKNLKNPWAFCSAMVNDLF